MAEREKVIRGLESLWRCVSPVCHTCGDCPYQDNHVECKRRVVMDAHALLKEQEPRVMTVDEVRDCVDYVWSEIFTPMNERRCLIYCPIGQNQGYSEMADLHEDSGQSWARRWDNYGKTWRCWTSRPTEEQRKAVKWE